MEEKQLVELRNSFTELLIANENHFGNLEKSKLKAAQKLAMNTFFEEIGCVSYNPESEELRAAVAVKRSSGYGGDLCDQGSIEYVRFYLDYGTGWVDQGLALFKAYDIPHKGNLCYTATLKIEPKQEVCQKEVLPRVRAILSWNQVPPANSPNWTPVWGNRKEAKIQIEPKKSKWAHLISQLSYATAQELLKLEAAYEIANPENVHESILTWKKEYGDEVETGRLKAAYTDQFKKLFPSISTQKLNKFFQVESESSDDESAKAGQCNTTYEELHCIGFNRRRSVLHGAIEIKHPFGYMGGLCRKGSREYITFFIRPLGSPNWLPAGTTSVGVHDLRGAARESIWYNAWLPIDIEKYRRTCKDPQIFEVQAILSWNSAATTADKCPNYGNIVHCQFEIPPREGEEGKPIIESLGGIQIKAIDQVTGLATGQSLFSTNINAFESPFDGTIEVNGNIYPGEKYQVLVKEPGSASFIPLSNTFRVMLTTVNPVTYLVTQAPKTQVPDSANYYDYLNVPPFQLVGERRLMNYNPVNPGMHELKIRTLSGKESDVVRFLVDKDRPTAKLDIDPNLLGAGNCGKFQVGNPISGTFSFKDSHFRRAVLWLSPNSGGGAGPKFNLTGDNDIVYPIEFSGTAITNGQWTLNTNGMRPCGYVINLRVSDRTIVNSAVVGKSAGAAQGFCLE